MPKQRLEDRRNTLFELGEQTGDRLAFLENHPLNLRVRLRLEALYER